MCPDGLPPWRVTHASLLPGPGHVEGRWREIVASGSSTTRRGMHPGRIAIAAGEARVAASQALTWTRIAPGYKE